MKKLTRILAYIALGGMTVLISGVLAFYLLIVVGLSPYLQTTWICSAMRTMSHQYLATAFFTDEYIEEVMAANSIDDSGYDSEILTFEKPKPVTAAPRPTPETTLSPAETERLPADTEPSETVAMETVPPEMEAPAPPAPDYIAEGYELLEDGIYLKEVSGLTWRGYMMLVSDPLRVRLVDTSQQYVCGENVMTMTTDIGGIAGINGGGFTDGPNYDSNGGTPTGLIIEQGELVWPLQPDNTVYNMIGINDNGALVLRHCTAQWALENNIVSAVSFAPFIVVNGEGLIKNGTGGWGIAPRTAIGQRETGELLLLVIDGRQADWSIGCDLDVLQEVMLEEGAHNAAMLDGGSSTAMVYQGEYINRPSLGHERWINNCFVVMPTAEETD